MYKAIRLLQLTLDIIFGALRLGYYSLRWGFKWIVLALALLSFALGVHFLAFGPMGLIHPSWARVFWYVWYARPSSGGSLVMGISFFLTGWFLVNHFRLLRATSRRVNQYPDRPNVYVFRKDNQRMELLIIFMVGVGIIARLLGGSDSGDRRSVTDWKEQRDGEGYYEWLQRVKPYEYNALIARQDAEAREKDYPA